ncbi:MAG: glycolate oxidase subunit GlcF [Rudaea sp.]|uniref:glycolate oxidase subunit GlcF n=1 Tax=unclassified Rudaea TaxID=2627037 RepID=UPI0010F91550|nr:MULTISPECIES: glycolate oxidase subunit GlcF [unclassified Rudaea]MBN8885383.1 glycolate oxidase subunit GlcF [Rudaea sp.]
MEAHLADAIKDTADGRDAEAILRTCVHCGFCNATCPTYQLTGDELDGPRGRIYQIKRVLEGEAPSTATQLHLDRCLTCRNCETTCPSGVKYGRLLDIGRAAIAERVPRSTTQNLQRGFLRYALTRRWLFAPAVRIGRALRGVLPPSLRGKLAPARDAGRWPRASHANDAAPKRVLLLRGCVQPALMPSIDAATARVLDACGYAAIVAPDSGCCGALDFHLDAQAAAAARARRNIDAWLAQLDAGAEAIVINASGCSAMVKDYAHLLRDDPLYRDKAQRVVAATRDLAEFLPKPLQALAAQPRAPLPETLHRVAFHPPCTLQHAQKITGAVEGILSAFGAELAPFAEAHLCCGSAGTYSILQPEFSQRLRERKLENLQRANPAMILSANVGCLGQLEPAAQVPVRHWIEWIDTVLQLGR